MSKPKTLTQKEINFCELFVFGCEPYLGNARKCYQDVFGDLGQTALMNARSLLEREDVKEYIQELNRISGYGTEELKNRLTEKLLRIIDETSEAVYKDRRGTPLSPAALRSVAVQATKTLMEMYPLRVAQENKLEIGGGGEGGIVFNVVVPEKRKENEE
jgi:hypothetical protein